MATNFRKYIYGLYLPMFPEFKTRLLFHQHDSRTLLAPPSSAAAYETNYEELKVQKGESWLYHAKRLEDFLAGKEYILGSKVSWVDFLIFEIMEFQRVFVPGSLGAFPNLKAFSARVAALPQVMTFSFLFFLRGNVHRFSL